VTNYKGLVTIIFTIHAVFVFRNGDPRSWHGTCRSLDILTSEEVNQMKIATTFLAALILSASLLVTAAAAAPEGWSDEAWQAHIQELRQQKQEQE